MSLSHPQDGTTFAQPLGKAGRWLAGHWLLVAAVLLYALGVNRFWQPSPDSALYLGLGRSLAEGQGYVFNYQPHTFVLPGFPAMIAAVMRAFGTECLPDRILPLNALMALTGLACLAASWLLLKELRVRKSVAFGVMLLLVFSRELYLRSTMVLTEMPFTLFVLLTVYAVVRTLGAEGRAFWVWLSAAGLAAACAALIRPFGLALPPAIVGALWLRPGGFRQWRRSLAASFVGGALAVAPLAAWGAMRTRVHQPGEPTYLWALGNTDLWRLLMVLPRLLEAVGRTLFGASVTPAGGAVVLALMVFGLTRAPLRFRWFASVFLAIYLGGVMLGAPSGRYLLPALPLMYLALAMGVAASTGWLAKRGLLSGAQRRWVHVACLAIVLAINGVRIGKVVWEQRSPDYYAVVQDGRWQDFFAATHWLKEHGAPGGTVLAYHARAAHLLTRLPSQALPRYEGQMSEGEMAAKVRSTHARYAILDPFREASTAPLEAIAAEHPDAAREVFRSGEVRVWELAPDAFPRAEGGALYATP